MSSYGPCSSSLQLLDTCLLCFNFDPKSDLKLTAKGIAGGVLALFLTGGGGGWSFLVLVNKGDSLEDILFMGGLKFGDSSLSDLSGSGGGGPLGKSNCVSSNDEITSLSSIFVNLFDCLLGGSGGGTLLAGFFQTGGGCKLSFWSTVSEIILSYTSSTCSANEYWSGK